MTTSEQLGHIAVLARYMTSGRAEDERADLVYWDTFWFCAETLSRRGDDWSHVELTLLSDESDLGGGDRMFMQKLLDDQESIPTKTID